jgi:alpha-beta hydrolase superfamily lysophospholipase
MDSSPAPSREPLPRRGRRLRRRLILLASLVPLWLLVSLVAAYRLTHRTRPRFDEPPPRVSWAKFEPLRLATVDGHDLGAWFAPGRDDRASVVLLHGNGGNRGSLLDRAELLAKEGYSVLPVTLRAHGDSTGNFNDFGYSARLDVVAAVSFLEARRPGRPIFIHGASLGAAAGIYAAKELGPRVAGYVLEAPYRDLRSAVRNRTRAEIPPGLEWVAYQGLLIVSPLVLPDIDRISPFEAIAGVPDDVPVLLIAGRHDVKATPEQVEALYDRVRSHGAYVVFETAGHLLYQQTDPKLFRSTVLDFLRDSEAKD